MTQCFHQPCKSRIAPHLLPACLIADAGDGGRASSTRSSGRDAIQLGGVSLAISVTDMPVNQSTSHAIRDGFQARISLLDVFPRARDIS
jgi:hypothetical protein